MRTSSALLCLGALLPSVFAASRPAERAAQAMVVTPDDQATAVGLEVLRAGGNAVDAAVAAALALAVVSPHAGNLGGGGFLLYRAADGSASAVDFREAAPRALRAELFLDDEGRRVPERSLQSGLAVGVPGSVAGLFEAHRRWGRLPWKELVLPAVRLARSGSVVSRWLAGAFASSGAPLLDDPEARRIFAPRGQLPGAGARLVQRDLAATLARVAAQGTDGFYRGDTARAIERSVRSAGGVITLADLEAYRPVLREPLHGTYRGHRVITFPPPSSGGVMLLQMLAMLEPHDLRAAGPGSSLTVHLLAEVQRRAFADRSRWIGDPGHVDVPLAGLLDRGYLAERAGSIEPARATPSVAVSPGSPPGVEHDETLHLSVADPSGGTVALTTTLNTWFGSGLVAAETGVLLNNEIDDFAIVPGSANAWGLSGEKANAIAPGKRPLSSMTPTIVELPEGGPRPRLVLGSPGGAAIVAAVLAVLVNVIDHDLPLQDAVDFPRFYHPWLPDRLVHEERAFAEDVRQGLIGRGHVLEASPALLGNVNAVGLDAEGHWLGAADPRREGSARGY
jgi:gamma-glutamyltranspeptidase/glutathione hydrolase